MMYVSEDAIYDLGLQNCCNNLYAIRPPFRLLSIPLIFPIQLQLHQRIASLQHRNPSPFGIDIRRSCPTIIGCFYWNDIPISIRQKPTKQLFERALPVLFCSVLITVTPPL